MSRDRTRAASEVVFAEARQTGFSAVSLPGCYGRPQPPFLLPKLSLSSRPSIHPQLLFFLSPLFSLFFLSSSSSSPLPHPSNSPFISLNLHHDVQKRSAAIQPRRGRCLCHWPDRFGEFSSVSSIPSGSSCPHPYLYNHLYHVPTTLPIYLPTIDIHRVFPSMDTIMPLNSLFISPSIFPGRA